MRAEEVAKIVKGKLIGNGKVNSIEFDSRNVKKGSLFVPLRGNRDGHQFIKDAFQNGASGTLSERTLPIPEGKFLIEVKNTFEAFKLLGKWKRGNFNGTTIAITGSVGKTTTKELLTHVFSKFFKTYRNVKSFNNILGLTYTLSNLPLDTELYIQELGTNRQGEIPELVEIVKPEISVVTAVEKAHTAGFKDISDIVKEKLSITEGAILSIVPIQFKEFSKSKETITFGREGDIKLLDVQLFPNKTEFLIESFGRRLQFFSPIPGLGVVNSTLIAVGLAEVFKVNIEKVSELIRTFTPPEMRLTVEQLNKVILIDDSYNANPKSMENAIKVLSLQELPKVAIIGEMLELGEESKKEHEKIGELLNHAKVETLIAYGKETESTFKVFKGKKSYFTSQEELIKFIKTFHFQGKAVLVKGSRGNRLEKIARIIRERYKS
ncbi:UDP-N-acetylmuramoylalanyl-D-glutamyl-2,6-diamin opimelate/D-alanyl-D-alanyl ligase [Desulfurobacterium thermolithotrophum DSM 11699]|uniref:UDP-N-acetylmuramoyl-tripeptide--D-alanyl-D-alanine ligase n=1 Tax=Desulfurobacterium thermolithotrophum (strain DSM 11699 / BSA) TaxID=868864 RepID=F0S433_DESTD|nr:UDP-N-acetylmuramoyl-tripeptide--D-alanyl-D-alanine ligase [Desulfurobacterium thermolithotrophum]ADY73605.1 UDP-N-acetylmuramoylalanyl-D-glutamyl-2,6-diamin opimelate/D-alanyl-D-alanyl ligase [Desulfurobacterium thermolithotrophum DSM 11699]